jgi:hypothetical protein
MGTTTELTFASLKNGNYRCNQTGELTKNCERYRNIHRAHQLKKTPMARDKEWRCPHCGAKNYFGILSEENACKRCSKKVIISRQLDYYID